jgi:hypothetical protein
MHSRISTRLLRSFKPVTINFNLTKPPLAQTRPNILKSTQLPTRSRIYSPVTLLSTQPLIQTANDPIATLAAPVPPPQPLSTSQKTTILTKLLQKTEDINDESLQGNIVFQNNAINTIWGTISDLIHNFFPYNKDLTDLSFYLLKQLKRVLLILGARFALDFSHAVLDIALSSLGDSHIRSFFHWTQSTCLSATSIVFNALIIYWWTHLILWVSEFGYHRLVRAGVIEEQSVKDLVSKSLISVPIDKFPSPTFPINVTNPSKSIYRFSPAKKIEVDGNDDNNNDEAKLLTVNDEYVSISDYSTMIQDITPDVASPVVYGPDYGVRLTPNVFANIQANSLPLRLIHQLDVRVEEFNYKVQNSSNPIVYLFQ